jgi:hypothetical protein
MHSEESGSKYDTVTYGEYVLWCLRLKIFWGSHGRKGIERLCMGSSTERVIGHAGKNVLVVTI